MSWARIDDRANEHRKQLEAGPEACWMWACGLMYANRQKARDGLIPERALGMLFVFDTDPKSLAEKLVAVGLWDRTEAGYQIHAYHEWNETNEQREKRLKLSRKRAAKSYDRKLAQMKVSARAEAAQTHSADTAQQQSAAEAQPNVSSGVVSLTDPTVPPKLLETDQDLPDRLGPPGARDAAPAKPKRVRRERWHRVPTSWAPNAEHREIAAKRGVDFDVELENFRDHDFDRPKVDADATFRTWLRRAFATKAPAKAFNRAQDTMQAQLDRVADLAAEEAKELGATIR